MKKFALSLLIGAVLGAPALTAAAPAPPTPPTSCFAAAEAGDLRNDAHCVFRPNANVVYWAAVTPFAYRISVSSDLRRWRPVVDVPVTSLPGAGSFAIKKPGTYVLVQMFCMRSSTTQRCVPSDQKWYGSETIGGVVASSYADQSSSLTSAAGGALGLVGSTLNPYVAPAGAVFTQLSDTLCSTAHERLEYNYLRSC